MDASRSLFSVVHEFKEIAYQTGLEYTYTVQAEDLDNVTDPIIVEGSLEDLAGEARAINNKKPVDDQGKEIEGLFSPEDPIVDMNDFVLLTENFGVNQEDPQFEPAFDLTKDGKVDLSDFFVFLENWGKEAVSQ